MLHSVRQGWLVVIFSVKPIESYLSELLLGYTLKIIQQRNIWKMQERCTFLLILAKIQCAHSRRPHVACIQSQWGLVSSGKLKRKEVEIHQIHCSRMVASLCSSTQDCRNSNSYTYHRCYQSQIFWYFLRLLYDWHIGTLFQCINLLN
jgi:hypothetical protein